MEAEPKAIHCTREELFEKVWSEPMIKLAKSFGISDVGLRKKCKKLNIPLPPQGYWVRKQFGKTTPRPVLPPFNGDGKVAFAVNNEKKEPAGKEEPEEIKAQIAFEQIAENKIHVPARLNSPHPLIVRFKESLQDIQRYEIERGGIISKGGELLDITVSSSSMDRALRLMDTLIKVLDARGYRVNVSRDESQPGARTYRTVAFVTNESIAFGVRENYTQKKREPEQAQKGKDQPLSYTYDSYEYAASGVLTLTIREYVGGHMRLVWSDGKRQKLEECLNSFIVGLVRAAVAKRAWRLERECEERERQVRQLEWIEQEERRRKEEANLKALLQEAENWSRSKLIREYTKAVAEEALKRHGAIKPGGELDRWIKWANQQADRIDPLVDSQV